MSEEKTFQERINYTGDLMPLLYKVCDDFRLGNYRFHHVITVGYEDLNICVNTDSGAYLVKALATFRDEGERSRYTAIIQEANRPELGIAHPRLYMSEQGYLHKIVLGQSIIFLFVMDFINGKSFYDLGVRPSRQEIKFLARQAALINKINLRITYKYDNWAIVNFVEEFEKTKEYLDKVDLALIEPIANKFRGLDLSSLPHCFVHGDIIDTNVLKDEQGQLWIIDFAVSNFNPRIQELAVLGCNLLFDPQKTDNFEGNYQLLLTEYQQELRLSDIEIDWLPTCIKVAHAMHVIGATRTKLDDGDSEENQHWLHIGREGLFFTSEFWR